jgi:hypothetical protein
MGTSDQNRLTRIYATSVVIPGWENAATPITVQGPLIHAPIGITQDPTVRIDFYIDTTHNVKKNLDTWMLLVQNKYNQLNYAVEYMRDFEVSVIDSVIGNKKDFETKPSFTQQLKDKFKQKPPLEAQTKEYTIARYKFVNCFPKSVSSITLDNGSSEYMRVSVEVYYEQMYAEYVGSLKDYEIKFPTEKKPKGIGGKLFAAGENFVKGAALGVADTAGGVVNGLKNISLK